MRHYLLLLFTSLCMSFLLLNNCGSKMTEEQLISQAANFENQAVALDEQGRNEEAKKLLAQAIKSYEKLIANYPESERAPEILYKLGTAYMNNLKDADKSIEAYRRLIADYPESIHVAKAYFMIGYNYANEVGDLEKAREAYNIFLEKYPDHDLATSVTWELENLGKDINEIEFLDSDTLEGNPELKK